MVDIANVVLDLYGGVLGKSDAVMQQMNRLQRALRAELSLQRELQGMAGALDMLMASSEIQK